MSNSIIDQQRDNETFFWVQHSWLPGPVKAYDHEQEFLHLQNLGKNLVYKKPDIEGLFAGLKKMLAGDNKNKKTNPFYWHE